MTDSKYGKNVRPLRLRTNVIYPSFRGKISDFSLVYDERCDPDSPIWTETYHAYAAGTGLFAPSELAPVVDGRPVEALKDVGQHLHDFDEVYFFYGTHPPDNTRLGGAVEMWLGQGEDAQKFTMTDPTAVYVPKGLAHNPWIVTKVDDPGHPVMITTVALTKEYGSRPETTTNLPYPPAFSADMIGRTQPGNGRYDHLVNRLTLSTDISLSQLAGRVCVPPLVFDDKICRAPVWAEFQLVYAGGTGVGVPTMADVPRADRLGWWDWTKGMQHRQNYDEVFLYLPTDPHDTLNLGGEVVMYVADEGHSITRPSAVYVPGGVPHNPQYYRRVERPYWVVVLAIVDNAKFQEGEFEPSPAPATFRF
jgi:hypothetical protein